MTLAVDLGLGSSVEVSGEEAAFRLKRPIDDRDPYDGGNGPKLTTVMKVEQKRANKIARPRGCGRQSSELTKPRASIPRTVCQPINQIEVTPDDERKGKSAWRGRGLRVKEDFTNDTRDGHWH